ncbi:hypothetical protein C5167_031072 [Papaver somniferum]|nr:hypothetical protein C5167_031072 [Papaver somniferum]
MIDSLTRQQYSVARVPALDHATSADGGSVVKVGSIPRYSTLGQPVEASQLYQVLHTPHPHPHQKKYLQAEVHLGHAIVRNVANLMTRGPRY